MMLAEPIMPTTPQLLNEKRRLSSRLNDMYLPKPKRPCLDSNVALDNAVANGVQSTSGRQRQSELLPGQWPPHKRTASLKADLQLSLFYSDSAYNCFTQRVSNDMLKSVSSKKSDVASKLNHEDMKEVNNGQGDDKIPVINLKKNGVKQKSESPVVERISALSTQSLTSSDVDSDCSESGRTSIPKSKIKQPAIVLTKMSQPLKKKATVTSSTLSNTRRVVPEVSSVVIGGYVHRMASLNARACVAAYLEPERKYAPKYANSGGHKQAAVSKAKCDSNSASNDKSIVSKVEPQKSKPIVLNLNGAESVIPVIKFDGSGSPCTLIIRELEDGTIPYNKEGLLYNGDTIHPDAQVFVADDQKLQLPKRIVPTLVPARFSTVRRAAKKAASIGILQSSKKHSKKNNGWCPLGEPIKVIEYRERSSKICRKYFVGIRRRKEDIFVRDSVVIKSESGRNDKPYVAKIGSIWQEPDGYLVMTTFWYYRPDDVKTQSTNVECVGRELLASQHHDNNSVACIEEKCYVLGYLQYCRYHASIVRSTIINPLNSCSSQGIVPDLSPQDDDEPLVDMDGVSLVELDPKKQEQEDLGPSLLKLRDTDPFLVFLCYRGYNHISGKIQSARAMKL